MSKRFLNFLGFSLGAILFLYFGIKFFGNSQAALDSLSHTSFWFFPVSFALYVLGIFFIALSWLRSLQWLGGQISLWKGLKIYGLSGIGKYIPGNIAQHVGRVVLGMKNGVPSHIVLSSLLIEFFLATMAALIPGLPKIFTDPVARDILASGKNWLLISLGLVILGIAVWLNKHRLKKLDFLAQRKISLKDGKAFALNFGLMLLGFVFLALLCAWVAFNLVEPQWNTFFSFALAFPIAWLAGYLAPGAPAGLGAREFILVLLLGSHFGEANVVTSAFILRFVTSLGDVFIFIVSIASGSKRAFSSKASLPNSHGDLDGLQK